MDDVGAAGAGRRVLSRSRPALAIAQDFPTKPITLILPYAAGGNTDVIARTSRITLSNASGQSVVVETRLGAASVIGAAYVARAAPDGYTILIGTSTTMAINVSIYKNLPYDPTKDLVPLALIAGVPFMLVVNPAFTGAFGARTWLRWPSRSRAGCPTRRTAMAAPLICLRSC